MSLREHNSKPFPRSVIERYQLRDIHFDKHPFQIDTSDRPTVHSSVFDGRCKIMSVVIRTETVPLISAEMRWGDNLLHSGAPNKAEACESETECL